MKKLYLLITLLFSAGISIAGAAPANDNFANIQAIIPGLTTTNIVAATVEANEPDTTTGRTVWYSYTATSDSVVRLDTTGTAFEGHFASVYLGTAINNLIYIDGGETSTYSSTPFNFSFKAKAGSNYKICAGTFRSGLYGTGQEVKLTLSTTPFSHTGPLYSNQPSADGHVTNDRFDNRTQLLGSDLTVINYMNSASVEAGEPDTNTGKTAWYTYTTTSDSVISIDTTGTEFQAHFVSVYMGNSINNLIEIAADYTSSYSSTPFAVSFNAKAGTTFQICVGCYRSDLYGDGTLLQLTLTTKPFTHAGPLYGPEVPTAPTPQNDSFLTPQILVGNQFTVIGSAASATIEPGESGVTKTLWYSWTATNTGLVRVDFPVGTTGLFNVGTGNSLQTLKEVVKRPESTPLSFGFNAVAGTTYKLLVASASGPFQFSLRASYSGANDAPFAKITSPGNGKSVSVNGFYMIAYVRDRDGVAAFQIKINGKLVISKSFPYSGRLFSGKVKKGAVTVQIRAKDTRGKWGPYRTIKVNAK